MDFLGEQITDSGTATSYFCGIPLYFDVKTTVTSQTPLFEQNELVSQSLDIFETVFKENFIEDLSYCRPSCAALFTWVRDKAMAGMPQLVLKILSHTNRPVINKETN